jgi:hypothetical protein
MNPQQPRQPQPKPQWTDAISNVVVCDFYYIFFVIFAIFAAISVLGGLYIFATTKMPFSQLIGVFFNIILTGGLSATSALFLYLICDRSLHPKYDGFQGAEGFAEAAAKKEGFKEGFMAAKKAESFQSAEGFRSAEGFNQSCEYKDMFMDVPEGYEAQDPLKKK